MFEVRIHGGGGQGAVMAAQALAEAAAIEGNYAVAFPFFGAERRGAPVLAFTRIVLRMRLCSFRNRAAGEMSFLRPREKFLPNQM